MGIASNVVRRVSLKKEKCLENQISKTWKKFKNNTSFNQFVSTFVIKNYNYNMPSNSSYTHIYYCYQYRS